MSRLGTYLLRGIFLRSPHGLKKEVLVPQECCDHHQYKLLQSDSLGGKENTHYPYFQSYLVT